MGGKERYRCLGKGKCFQGLWFLLVRVEVVTSDLGCSQQCSSCLPHEREQQLPWPQSWLGFLALGLHTGHGDGGKEELGELCLIFSLRYIGKRAISSMVIVEVSLLSGFVLAPGSGMPVRSLESG